MGSAARAGDFGLLDLCLSEVDLEDLSWLGEGDFLLEWFVSLERDLDGCLLGEDVDLALLEEDVGVDPLCLDEGCLLECLVVFGVLLEGDVGAGPLCLDADLCPLGVEGVCLLGDLICADPALLEEDVGDDPLCLDVDLVLLEEDAGDDPLCLFEGAGE